tara:strand:- start:514 stop:900 length:387 start_codon:yes stop_codon:yes gene_type:complete
MTIICLNLTPYNGPIVTRLFFWPRKVREEVRSEYNLTINDAEKVFLDHWYSKAVSYIPPIDGLPKQGMLIERILHFGYVSFHIYFEEYEERKLLYIGCGGQVQNDGGQVVQLDGLGYQSGFVRSTLRK